MQVLIVKVSSLGDVVHNMPVVQDILRRYPDAQIDWVVEEGFVDLVKLVRGVRRVIPFALRRWRKKPFAARTWQEIGTFRRALRETPYDYVIDTQGLVKTGWIARTARGAVWGLGNRTEGASYEWPVRYLYRHMVRIEPHTHVVTRSRLLVAGAMGFTVPDEIDFGIATERADHSQCPDRPYAVFVHATSRDDKTWPEGNWIALGRDLAAQGFLIVLPWGSAGEHAVSVRLAEALGKDAWVPPKMNLSQVVGLIDRGAITVGVDTGLVHIAAALNRPTIELYNFSTAWRTGGFWSPRIINLGDAEHKPTLAQVRDAVRQLAPAPVASGDAVSGEDRSA
ncbi:lipopolysaccharide heptosyltransferase I [Pandoraea apista]|uniref:Lipopolysaccharide heptosyltransferase 1 n=2 Tax=Pandoraea apista TaxID=93218 RepID=A0ABX9ZJI1_9BURK|nr:lipopolysaccharide heptosyltransferase I [Pandoraea apista]RRJ27702.1 lipopolysaccharide heptosyltransferase I [Pandoraea apista]RRJ73219.1 lipopolysaccharide heptosyltransferase I [Pandoraea apista]RSD06637.1 lipopolysaccharide heptosyltransferase I [Pandoraea apista]RSD09777.1 lipopolysaccharide heptosyltransferase I [Pandoraea apista]